MSAKYEIVTKELTDIRLKSTTIAVRKEGMNAIFTKGAERKKYIPVACAIARPRKTIISGARSATNHDQNTSLRATHSASDLPAPFLY